MNKCCWTYLNVFTIGQIIHFNNLLKISSLSNVGGGEGFKMTFQRNKIDFNSDYSTPSPLPWKPAAAFFLIVT